VNPWKGIAGLPAESWVLFFATLINRAGTMVLPFLVLYLTGPLQFSPSQAGLVIATYGVGAMITGPLAGSLADRIGEMLVMRLSLIATGFILLSLLTVKSFAAVVAVCLLWSIVSEAFRPANMSVITGMVAPEQRKTAVALNRLAVNLGMSIGPAAGGFLTALSFTWLFVIDAATSILAGIVLILYRVRTKTELAAAHAPAEVGPAAIFSRKWQLFLFLASLFPAWLVFFQTQAAMPLYLVRQMDFSEAAFGLLLTVNTVLIIFLEVPLNAAMSHWRHRRALPLGAILCAAGFGALAFVTGFWTAALTVVIWTFGEMILFPASSAYVADLSPADRRGAYMGWLQVSFSTAFTLGPWLGARLLELAGARTLWTVTFALGTISAVLMLRLKGGVQPAHATRSS
jgi:MFS family permease